MPPCEPAMEAHQYSTSQKLRPPDSAARNARPNPSVRSFGCGNDSWSPIPAPCLIPIPTHIHPPSIGIIPEPSEPRYVLAPQGVATDCVHSRASQNEPGRDRNLQESPVRPRLSQTFRVNPLAHSISVVVEEIRDPPPVTTFRGRGEVHRPARDHELIEYLHRIGPMRFAGPCLGPHSDTSPSQNARSALDCAFGATVICDL